MLLSLLSPSPTEALSCVQFAVELEQCIRDAAKRAVDSWSRWGDGCLEATTKVDIQADVLGETITPFEETYGYQAALWCAFYSTRMTEEPDPDNPQPNNPDFEVRSLPYSQWLPRSQRSVGSDASVDYSLSRVCIICVVSEASGEASGEACGEASEVKYAKHSMVALDYSRLLIVISHASSLATFYHPPSAGTGFTACS